MKLRITDGAKVRAHIASSILREDPANTTVGCVTLKPHQTEAVQRARKALDEFGGVLLADPVGTGKTYVALAMSHPRKGAVVVGPAVLREMWESSAARCGRQLRYITFESLSRGKHYDTDSSLVIVDEAHHARNTSTQRFAAISRLVSGKQVILLSATPIHNRRADLVAILSLFMGSRAESLSDADLARAIVRRGRLSRSVAGMPSTGDLQWLDIRADARIPRMLMSMPPPLPVSDGGDGGALVVHSLLRQWMSSNAALIGGLRRRLARAEALIAALDNDTWPSATELSAWIAGDDTVQLGLPGLLAAPTQLAPTLSSTVALHRDALIDALALARSEKSDNERTRCILELAERFPGRKIVVFSQYADSIEGLVPNISRQARAAALTGSGGIVIGGHITRTEVLRRFAPIAHDTTPPRRADEIDILLATDLLSEGVNLQDAGIVVHLDLPWTPARMEQRLGRIARIGSPHNEVLSFAFRPPDAAEAIVRIESILKRKMREAGIVTGVLPSLSVWRSEPYPRENALTSDERIRELLRGWLSEQEQIETDLCPAASVRGSIDGFVGLAATDGKLRLVVEQNDRITEDPEIVLGVLRACSGSPASVQSVDLQISFERFSAWLSARQSLSGVRGSRSRSGVRERVLERLKAIVRKSARHSRPLIAQNAALAASILLGRLDVHSEHELRALVDLEPDEVIDGVIRLGERFNASRQIESAHPKALLLIRR